MKVKELSVFFPTFNEEGNIERTVNNATRVLEKLKLKYEIIIVNDGSKDKTQVIAENLAKNDSQIKVINHPYNMGYGEALKSGFYNAKYDTIVYTDGDGQFDFSEVTKFLEKIDSYDVLVGFRIKRRDPFFRILFKEGWRLTQLIFFRLTLKDVDCGFKMIKRKILENISKLESQRGAMINAELVIKAKKAGFKIDQVGVTHYPRLSGNPTGASLKVIFKSYLDLIKLWWKLKEQKEAFIIFLSILVLATLFRLYRISEYMTFLGDEGRDALVVRNMLIDRHFPLIGPPTSVGNIYLGPLYYYMMAVPMFFVWLNPVSAAVMNALIGVATVALIYYFSKQWFSRMSGLIASFLYAISPVTIIYSKSSWNPNPAPFFALLSIGGLYQVNKTGNFLWLILTGVTMAATIQMHYLGLILIPVVFVIWLNEIIRRKTNQLKVKKFFLGTVLGIFSFFIVMSPLFWFDIRHNFLNYRAITELFSQGGSITPNILENLSKIPEIYTFNLIGRYMAASNWYLSIIVGLLVLLAFRKNKWPILALGIWLLVGLIGLSFYKGNIYDHYLGFLNPAPFLLLGSLATIKKGKLVTVFLVILVVILTVLNLQKNPNLISPNRQLQRTQEVSKFILGKSQGQDFNFALLSQNNYDAAYQFYLDLYGNKPKMVPFDKTNQLFVVCEDQVCDPTHSPKYEVAAFGMSKIEWLENYAGVKVYKLLPNPTGQP